METKHTFTPGPLYYKEGMIYGDHADGHTIATVRDEEYGPLLAASPELLEACKEFAECMAIAPENTEQLLEIAKSARAAIAKATQ
jgi:hypothetical protein